MESIRKRLVALSLATVTLLQVPLMATATEATDTPSAKSSIVQPYDRGDVTGDGRITLIDAMNVLRHSVGLDILEGDAKKAADVNLDERANSLDALIIQRFVAGIISDFDNINSDIIQKPNTDTDTTVTDSDIDSEETDTDIFGGNAEEDTSITVSNTSYSVPAGMTLYVTAGSSVTWGSTNESIATVDSNGLILAKAPGTVKIVALKGDKKRTINVTVTESEAIRTVYSSPNSASKGSTVKLIATTDQTRTNVRFNVNVNGKLETVYASEKVADNEHGIYTWTGYITANTSGTFEVIASSEKNGSWTTCNNGKTTMFVSSSTSSTQVAHNTLRASDAVIEMISLYEGGLTEAEIDPLAYGTVMNYGYGVVIYAGDKFYNRASMSEYFADLVNQINENSYSSYVNNFLQENGIKYNQHQFDALVCFVYNLGVYSLQNAGLKSILLNCYEPSADKGDDSVATVDVNGYLNLRSGAGTNYSVIGKLYDGTKVTILDPTMVNGVWLKVKTEDGLVGYCSSDYLIFGSSSGTRNFNYIDSDELIEELLCWHHAGGNCYWGLLYRRIDELELFIQGDYTKDGYANKNYWDIPDCIG